MQESFLSNKWSWLRGALFVVPLTLAAGGLLVAEVPTNGGGEQSEASAVSPEKLSVAHALSDTFREVSKQVLPAVVAIENRPSNNWQTAQPPAGNRGMPQANPFEGTPFEEFFGEQFEMPSRPAPMPYRPSGIGSGVIVDSSGIVLTNNHVVAGGGNVTVRLADGREFEAIEVLTDPKSDIAVVKIESDSPLPSASLGDSDTTEVGDWVIALGQPFGLESTVTAGIVSAKNRGIGITDRENFIQTDAAINPGNSGGPLVNLYGQVVGINTAIKSSNGGNNGIGFAVPSNLASWVKDQLLSSGAVQRAYLGVGIQPVDFELAKEFGISPRTGVAITNVMPGSPADKAGILPGDILMRFGSKSIRSPQELQIAVERSPLGKAVEIEVVRDGETLTLTYEGKEAPGDFGNNPSAASESKSDSDGKRLQSLGLEIRKASPQVAKQLGFDSEGLVITSVRKGSSADAAGLKAGMMIEQVNRQDVASVEEFQKLVDGDEDGTILLLVRMEQGSRFIVLNK